MYRVRLLAVCFLFVLLFPGKAFANEPASLSLCSLPPELRNWPKSLNIIYADETFIPVNGQTIRVSVCAPADEADKAAQIFERLTTTLPLLSQLAGLHKTNTEDIQLILVPRSALPKGVDGRMLPQGGIIELHAASFDWSVVHEGAHYWSNELNFAEQWMIEGYAEYLTGLVKGYDHWSPEEPALDQICAHVPLLTWDNTQLQSPTLPCGYAIGARVFRQLADAVGAETLRLTLVELSQGREPITSEQLLIALERASSRDLVPIMKHTVFPASWDQILDWRSALRPQLLQAAADAYGLGATIPPRIGELIDSWRLADAQPYMQPLRMLLDSARAVEQRCAQLQVACDSSWRQIADSPEGIAAQARALQAALPLLEQVLPVYQRAQEQGFGLPPWLADAVSRLDPLAVRPEQLQATLALLETHAPLQQRSAQIGIDLPPELIRRIADFDPNVIDELRTASVGLERGAAFEQECANLSSLCSDWRRLWSSGAYAASEQHINEISAFLQRGRTFEQGCAPGFAPDCAAIWKEAFRSGGISAGDTAINATGALLQQARIVEERCPVNLAEICASFWQAKFRTGGDAAARTALSDLAEILREGEALETACKSSRIQCPQQWHDALARGDDTAAQQSIAAAHATLDQLVALGMDNKPPFGYFNFLPGMPGNTVDAQGLTDAYSAFAQGKNTDALRLAREAQTRRVRAQQQAFWGPVATGTALLLVICTIVFWRYRHRRQAAKRRNDTLLRELLKTPPIK